MNNILSRIPYGAVLVGLFLIFLSGAPLLALTTDWAKTALFTETGFFETASVVLYVIVAILFIFGPYELPARKWMIGLICLLFAARELDIHELITNGDFLFFPKDFKANFPFEYSVIEIAGIIFVATLILATVISYSAKTTSNLKAGDKHQTMMITGWICVGIAIALDGIREKIFQASGFILPAWANTIAESMEEIIEFMIPVCFLFGLLQYYKTRIWTSKTS